jgi:hypothetical protein
MRRVRELKRKHWIIWNYLSEHFDKDKKCALKECFPEDAEKIPYNCYLCMIYSANCCNCELGKISKCATINSYFTRWLLTDNDEERVKYARLIRDVVPKPEGVEE